MSFSGARGKVLEKEIRACVRMSEANEIMITTRGMRGSLDTVFYTVDETKELIEALKHALHSPMCDLEVPWKRG